jgi:hypothetical protein
MYDFNAHDKCIFPPEIKARIAELEGRDI